GPRIVDGDWVTRRPRRPSQRFGHGSMNEYDQRIPDDEPVYDVNADAPDPVPFRTGDPVTHELHGSGRVVAVTGDGRHIKAVVDFPEAGRKPEFVKFLRATDDGLN